MMHRSLDFDPVISGDDLPAYNFTNSVRKLAYLQTKQNLLCVKPVISFLTAEKLKYISSLQKEKEA